jgi:YesN/AraC family two-component response regulator
MTSPATVLIVDDEKHTREGLRLSLEQEGASSGSQS